MSDSSQSFENHAKMVPLFHGGAFGLIGISTIYFLVMTVTDFSKDRVVVAAFAVGAILLFWFTRAFPLGVQDRVIRLEERLRMERLLPEDLSGRINEIPTTLLIGLRFASDEELPELTRQVLDGRLTDQKSVKRAVKSWRADHQRI